MAFLGGTWAVIYTGAAFGEGSIVPVVRHTAAAVYRPFVMKRRPRRQWTRKTTRNGIEKRPTLLHTCSIGHIPYKHDMDGN